MAKHLALVPGAFCHYPELWRLKASVPQLSEALPFAACSQKFNSGVGGWGWAELCAFVYEQREPGRMYFIFSSVLPYCVSRNPAHL